MAISPTNVGFGFAVFEGSDRLIDWGLKSPRIRTNAQRLKGVTHLFQQYLPDVVVIENLTDKSCRRGRKGKELLAGIGRLASHTDIEIVPLTRAAVKAVFVQDKSWTKHQIATTIATELPELTPWLPKPRKPWMSEDSRMSIFGAAALALAFFRLGLTNGEASDTAYTARR